MAFSLAATFWYLLYHPSACMRLTAEVRAAFARVSDIRGGPTLKSCSYLQACIKETMRLCPPIATHLPRHVQAGGITVDDHEFPEGAQIGVAQYSLFRNSAYFPEPLAWHPERWIIDAAHGTSVESVHLAHKAFFPFSFGPRVCVGQAVADMQLRVVFARALWTYDMRMAPDAPCCTKTPMGQACDPEMVSYVASTLPEGGPMAQFKKRDDLVV
jgi:cytochrome P450